jgi:hypothetical protein
VARYDTRMRQPPVRIGLASARVSQAQMLTEESIEQTNRGAGNYGQREARFASVPIRLRIQANAGPNSEAAREAAIAMGVTRRKKGYPPIVTVPTGV